MNRRDIYGTEARPKAGWRTWLLLGLAALAVAFYASPLISLHFLRQALREGNAHAIEKRVDFVAVRSSIKEQMKLRMLAHMAKDQGMKDNPFAGLAMALGPAMVDNMVDASVTADGIAYLINEGKLKGQGVGASPAADPGANILRKGFASYNDFELEFVSGVKVWLRLEFPLSWRVYKVQMPVDA